MTIADLKPYPGYKPSGVAWLGKLPTHWETRRIKNWLAVNQSVLPEDTDPDYVFDYLEIGSIGTGRIVETPETVRFEDSPSRARRIVKSGDTIVSTVRTYLKAIWHADSPNSDLVASTGFAVLTPRSGAYPKFVSYLCQSEAFTNRVVEESVGVAYPAIAETKLANFHVGVPPVSEQTAIVRFLDYADRRIRRSIRAKEKLIALLEEQKQAVIHQAVTGQIDVRAGQRYPAYKPSGVECLGDVPAHWGIARLKDVAQVQTGLTLGKDYGGLRTISRPYLRVANVQAGHLNLGQVKSIDVPTSEAERSALSDGDVLMTEGGDIDKLGRGCIWNNEIPGCLHQNHIFAVRCNRNSLDPKFLVGLMASQHGRAYFQLTAKQTTNLASTNSTTLRAFPIPLPPLDDQLSILHAISETANALDSAGGRAATEIDLLREYRTRLIADVVTGKLDIRKAAATLPEEPDDAVAVEAHCDASVFG